MRNIRDLKSNSWSKDDSELPEIDDKSAIVGSELTETFDYKA